MGEMISSIHRLTVYYLLVDYNSLLPHVHSKGFDVPIHILLCWTYAVKVNLICKLGCAPSHNIRVWQSIHNNNFIMQLDSTIHIVVIL